jgi:hypothetical protein
MNSSVEIQRGVLPGSLFQEIASRSLWKFLIPHFQSTASPLRSLVCGAHFRWPELPPVAIVHSNLT